jgi:hypothetical protein
MLWIGQFGMEGGEAREKTPWVGAFAAEAGGADEPSDLYLVVEPATPGSEEFCQDLKEAVGEVFHKQKLSLTGGVLRSLRAAHEQLRDWNRKSIKEHRVAAGVSCLALRGNDAFLAQVAPAAAFLYRAGVVMRIEPRLPDALEPLGLYEEFRPEFSQYELEDDDRLLILSPRLAAILNEDELVSALALRGEDALPELYRRARDVPDCGALLIATQTTDDSAVVNPQPPATNH